MNKIKLSDYLKKIDPEFTDIDDNILSSLPEAYLLDNDDGIKKCCDCSNLKSVDFFLEKDGHIYFIEFSDLALEEKNKITELLNEMKTCGTRKCPAKKMSS